MPFDASSRLLNASMGEKVAALSDFIAKDIEARAARLSGGSDCYLLIARSPDSPVAQALRMHTSALPVVGVRVKAIFSEIEAGRAATILRSPPFSDPCECRVARDQRLLAAHEQLVLSPDCAWIGDSMRRDPSRRDTYERFAVQCPETARNAALSFERLWRMALPAEVVAPLAAVLAPQAELTSTMPALPEGIRRQ
jgi:hypothetical protein